MKRVISFLYILITVCIAFIGFHFGRCQSTSDPIHQITHPFEISVIYDSYEKKTVISAEELGKNYNQITYYGLAQVNLKSNEETIPLEQSISDGEVTIEQIIGKAETDVRRNLCQKFSASYNGLTSFRYRYSSYELWYINDIFEAPDGNEYLIQEFAIGHPGKFQNFTPSLTYLDENGTYVNLSRENWGITLEIDKVSSTSLTLNYTQSGGQHVGELYATDYSLYKSDGNNYILLNHIACSEAIALVNNTSSQFQIGLEEDLPSGNYLIRIFFEDKYDTLHDFMKNYTDKQGYDIQFSIP